MTVAEGQVPWLPPPAHQCASMGPQLDSCGRSHRVRHLHTELDASMGPQLDSCGRERAGRPGRPDGPLQWGRNLTVAEGCAHFPAAFGPVMLQWGRNLTVAEGPALAAGAVLVEVASMGPQLDSCGRHRGLERFRQRRIASMGPQLDSCGRPPRRTTCSSPPPLQWGRNLTVAEGSTAIGTARRKSALQWGRNLTVAEGWTYVWLKSSAQLLQWGRNLTVAEGASA